MSDFSLKMSQVILEDDQFKSAYNSLFTAYLSKLVGEEFEVETDTSRKLSTCVQYFYKSGNEKITQEGASLLSMMLDIFGEQTPELIQIAENLFYQVGDFPNLQLLGNTFHKLNFYEPFLNKIEKDIRSEFNTVREIEYPLTDYQRSLWHELINDQDIITSAPTSAGKSYLVLHYLVERLINSDGAFAAVIVPTRALISEISKKILEITKAKGASKDIEVCTIPKEGPFKDKTFFVMTQERLFEVLQSGDITFNFLFIDEAHNISDNTRGVLLHLTLQKLIEGSNPQIITSMPSRRYENAFSSVFEGIDFTKNSTFHSPVSKLLIEVKLTGRNICFTRVGGLGKHTIPKKFNGRNLGKIVYRIGKNDSNIIYRNQTNYCEATAQDISDLITEDVDSDALREAADYVENFLHEEFSLANNLRKGVAFHYGPLPGTIRSMIEDLVRGEEISYVVCTSTLAEGINLPAKNLFLTNPTQPIPFKEPERLESVKINNITGRAGRMLEHFGGNIFLVNHDDWKFQDYFDNDGEEQIDKIPTYYKVLNEDLDKVIKALDGIYDHEEEQYLYYTIANKLIKELGNANLNLTIDSDHLELPSDSVDLLVQKTQEAFENLAVDQFTLEANPSIGFIQQSRLYNLILENDDLSMWAIPHPKSPDLYEILLDVVTVLHASGIFLPKETNSLDYICLVTKKWIIGEPIKSIINEQIHYDQQEGNNRDPNASVRRVIKVINNDIRFRLSTALRCFHSLLTSAINLRNLNFQSVKLYTYIEVGACEDRIVQLVNLGLSRDTAIEINRILAPNISVDSLEKLRVLNNQNRFQELHPITQKEIYSLTS